MRRARTRLGRSSTWILILAGGLWTAAEPVAAGGIFTRSKSDLSSQSVAVSIDDELLKELPLNGRSFDQLVMTVPGVREGNLRAGHLPENWTFDGATARGPAISSGNFRFDLPVDFRLRKKVGLELWNGGRSIWRDRIAVETRDPIEVSHDATQFVDLPRTFHAGSDFSIADGTRNKWGTDLSWKIEPRVSFRLPVGSRLDWDWQWEERRRFVSELLRDEIVGPIGGKARWFGIQDGRPVVPPSGGFRVTDDWWNERGRDRIGVARSVLRHDRSSAETRGSGDERGGSALEKLSVHGFLTQAWADADFEPPADLRPTLGAPRTVFGVTGFDGFGEVVVQDHWIPIVLPPLPPPAQPLFTGITEVVAPHESFCVSGHVGDLSQWNGLEVGGVGLGAPIFASSTAAIFLPPVDLAPGVHRISYVPWGDTDPDTGLSTAYIAIQARIHKQRIRTGNQTTLTLGIVGTERSFPVRLENKSPEIINLEGRLIHDEVTTGGADNRIDKTITGLTPGNYDIYYEVTLPTCPGEEGSLRAADAADALLQGLVDWSESLGGTTAETGRPSDSGGELADELTTEGFDIGGPVLKDRLWYWTRVDPERAESTPGCEPGASTLSLGGDRFRVRADFEDFEPTESGACVDPQSDDTGLFYFFAPENGELLVKVLDGCEPNNRWWVFSAATTDVEYSLTVTDTQSGSVKTYDNPLGAPAQAITDTQAFATCP